MTSHAEFRGVLRSMIAKADNWPCKPDPRLKIETKPHGWLLTVLLECESACWGRWDHWFRTMEAGHVLNEPIPQIDFQPDVAGLARKMHEKSLDAIARGSWLGWDSWRIFDGGLPCNQAIDGQCVANDGVKLGQAIRTQNAVEDYSTLAKVVEAWPRLNANLKAAIAAIVASQENQNHPNEPEIGGM